MKNLYALLWSLFLVTSLNAQVLNVPTTEQEQTNWCWNGVSKSALDYYGFVEEQCVIAEWVRNERSGYGNDPCCENPSGPCNSSNVLYNSNGSMQEILFHFGGITSEMKGFAKSEAGVADAIARNAVIPCAWAWSAGGGHAVLIHGYVSGNVYYMDPWYGEGKKIATYANFSSGNDGSQAGHHTWTQGLFFTSDVSAVDTIPCATPQNLAASVSGSDISLSWSVVASAQAYNIQYREQGTSPWTSTSSSSNTTTLAGLSSETTYEFQVAAVCNSVSESDFSTSTTATTEAGPVVYCSSNGNSVTGEWIQSVSIGSINNTSNANAGYADFTAQSTAITAGTTANITLTPGFPSNWLYGTTTQPEFWAVWIDLNQDGDFADAQEQRFVSSTSTTTAVSASISIPSGTLAGTTRMRIAMKRGAAPTSCESFANGEVEDYSIEIIANDPVVCTAPTNLSNTSITASSATLSWNAAASATGYILKYRESGLTWNITNVSTTSFNLTGLNESTNYEWAVTTDCGNGNLSAESATQVFTTLEAAPAPCNAPTNLQTTSITTNSAVLSWNAASNATTYVVSYREAGQSWNNANTNNTTYNLNNLNDDTNYEWTVRTDCGNGNESSDATPQSFSTEEIQTPTEYCSASGSSASEWLEAISIGAINNTSGNDGGYGDYTAQSADLELGESVDLTITPGFPYNFFWGYTTQPEFYSVWIDLNQDGDFDDANELQYVSPSSNSTYQAFTVSLSIPTSAALGETRMRVAMKRDAAANPCGSYSNGEVEDYTVTIVNSLAGAANGINDNEALTFKLYPNPADNFITIESDHTQANYQLVATSGQVILSGTLLGNTAKLDVSQLTSGAYLIKILSDKRVAVKSVLIR